MATSLFNLSFRGFRSATEHLRSRGVRHPRSLFRCLAVPSTLNPKPSSPETLNPKHLGGAYHPASLFEDLSGPSYSLRGSEGAGLQKPKGATLGFLR